VPTTTSSVLTERLYVSRESRIHGLPAHVKILVVLGSVVAIVATPPTAVWAFLLYFVLVRLLLLAAHIPFRTVAPRLLVELPFVVFALLLPVFGTGPRVSVGPVTLSEAGLWAAWGLLAKATLGVMLSVILASTTSTADFVNGLQRLRLPEVLVQMTAAMVRYVNVVVDEWHRMSRAREARGFEARGPRAWPMLGRSLGALFIRAYERGERVHLAMLARGYSGRMPELDSRATVPLATWLAAASVPVCFAVVAVLANMLGGLGG